MVTPEPWAVRTAKRTVARWFTGREVRRFLPLAGPALPVIEAEELAITAAAELAVAKRFQQMNERINACLLLIVGVPICYAFVFVGRSADAISVEQVIMGSLLFATVSLPLITWRCERALLDLREAIALFLRERQLDMVQQRVRSVRLVGVDVRRLAPWLYWATVLSFLWPLLGSARRAFQ